MEFPVNLVIEIKSQEELDAIRGGFSILSGVITSKDLELVEADKVSTVPELLERHQLRRIDSHKEARVLINGTEVAIGTKEEMIDRFKTECSMHQSSNIVVQEWIDGEFKPTLTRRIQQIGRR